MNNFNIEHIFRFFLLILLQIMLFDNIHLLNIITPYPYIFYIILFPVTANKKILYMSSFILGLTFDMFHNSGGVHAFSTLILAGLHGFLTRKTYGESIKNTQNKIGRNFSKEFIVYISVSTLIHHFILFYLDLFSVKYLPEVIIKTIGSSILTVIFIIIFTALSKKNER